MSDFKVAGLASGFDWTSMVDQLMEIERVPQQRLRAEQNTNSNKLNAFSTLSTKLSTLQSRSNDIGNSTLFNTKTATLGDDTLGITVSAGTDASEGKFEITVSQLAKATKRVGTADVGGAMGDENTIITNLRLNSDISEGTFQINGQDITVSGTDTLQDVFDSISAATSGVVTGSYDSGTDKVILSSASGQLELGSDDDTSNFLTALKLDQLEVVDAGGGASEVSSKGALGVVDLASDIASSGLSTSVTGSGTFYVNGVSIDFDADTESMSTLMERVNDSAAGVKMSYDSATDTFRMNNSQTGAYSMPVIDSGNGMLAALGLTGSADVGEDLEFSVDGGATLSSRSNIISSLDHGIDGVTVTAGELGTQTVTLTRDSEEVKSKIESFIAAFNDVQDYIGERTKIEVNDDEVTAGTLAGNREITSLDSQLRGLAFSSIDGLGGQIFRLEHMGIDFISGTSKLEVKDSSALTDALENNLDTLEDFFMGDAETSFSARMDTFIDNFIGDNGVLDVQKETLTKRTAAIDVQIEDMERRIAFKQSALEASFIAMERAQQNINNQSAALSSLNLG